MAGGRGFFMLYCQQNKNVTFLLLLKTIKLNRLLCGVLFSFHTWKKSYFFPFYHKNGIDDISITIIIANVNETLDINESLFKNKYNF